MTTKISPKLETFVDSASNEHGFILITTGFSNHWATAPDETVNNMLEAIRAQPEKRFVWQYNSPTVLKNTPKNLYVDGWLAQQNLLGMYVETRFENKTNTYISPSQVPGTCLPWWSEFCD
jgi:UDP:flavonoid glycosyltransferase YjiC (YdhE family)